ncbi:hypothetical protein VZT92_010596 [Zoarces viviparus]|uniref:Uncharacterized protein n=1 Tax=Zoarces viviparus TaxID=48416 RepID=A0AAW1F8U0_ZOAVI
MLNHFIEKSRHKNRKPSAAAPRRSSLQGAEPELGEGRLERWKINLGVMVLLVGRETGNNESPGHQSGEV